MVHLKNLQLGIADLMNEAGRQAGVEIVCEAKDTKAIKVHYDCSANLNQILQATVGYYRSTQNLELAIVWNGKKVTLKPLAKIEATSTVQPEEEDAQSVTDSDDRRGNLWKWIRSKWPPEKSGSNRAEEEEMGSTLIKKMDLSEKNLEDDDVEVSEVDALPSRLQVEIVSPQGQIEPLSDLDVISLPVPSKAVSVELEKIVSAELGKVAPAELAKVAPAELGKEETAELGKVAPAELGKAAPAELGKVAPADLAKVALAELGKVAPADLAKVAPAELAKVAPAELHKVASAELGKAAPAELAKAAPVDLAKIASAELGKAAPAELAKAAPVELAKAAPADFASVVPADLTKAAPAELAKVVPTDLGKAAPVDLAKVASADQDKIKSAVSANIVKESLKKLELAEGLPDL